MRKDRMPDAVLVELLGRLAISVAAGIDLRRSCRSEAGRVPSRWRPAMRVVADRLDRGDDLAAALAAAGDAFPSLVVGMVRIGDHTGRLAEVLRDTAASLQQSATVARTVRRAVAGPVMQLAVAAVAVAAIAVASSTAVALNGEPLDLLGLGLAGRPSLAILSIVTATVVAAAVAARCAASSWKAVGRRLPVLGAALHASEGAAWCRAAALAAHVGAGPGEMVDLAATVAPGLASDRVVIEARLRRGDDLATALREESRLPQAAVEAVAVGELTGTTAEALDRSAEALDAAARRGLLAAVQAAGFVAWGLAAAVAGVVVIRVITTYAGIIQDAARP